MYYLLIVQVLPALCYTGILPRVEKERKETKGRKLHMGWILFVMCTTEAHAFKAL